MTTVDTIFALSSAPGRAGVAVVRVTGPQALPALRTLAGGLPPPRTAVLRRLIDPGSGEAIDHALILWFPGPASFTGEDIAEFQIHGGRAVIQALLAVLAAIPGCRMAEPGEFSRRAFEAGKMDLTAAEGLADLIDAETEAQRRQALRQADGRLAALYDSWRERLIAATALQEAAIDFSDEQDIADSVSAPVAAAVADLIGDIKAHLADGRRGELLREGFQIVLAGAPNAGKSSLLNALAQRDVAIVSAEAGTTRDVIEVRLDLKGYPVVISDTAGLREASGQVEREGIRRTMARATSADLVVWLIDATAPVAKLPDQLAGDGRRVLRVLNKIDCVRPERVALLPDADLTISAVTGDGLAQLISYLADAIGGDAGCGEGPVLTRARHRQQLEQALRDLSLFQAGSPVDSELRAEDLRRAAHALGRITGRIDVEDVLDRIFASFCIGK